MKYDVTMTMTCGRRLNLFKKTVESIKENFLDYQNIDKWVCVDDRSSEYDYHSMEKRYKFIEFHHNEKHGQFESLKMILDLVDTEWIMHTEDDWTYIHKDTILDKLFAVAADDDRLRNVTLRFWKGPYVKHGDLEYYVHHFRKEPDDFRHSKRSDCDWYSVSFNPGILHVPTLRECFKATEKQDDLESRVWDKAIAKYYLDKGYKRANLTQEYIRHTGNGKSFYTCNL